MDVITLTVGLGGEQKTDGLRERAKRAGALDSVILDARDEFVEQLYLARLTRWGDVRGRLCPIDRVGSSADGEKVG